MTGEDDTTDPPDGELPMDDHAEAVDWLRAAFRDAPADEESTENTVGLAVELLSGDLSPAQAEAAAAELVDVPARGLEVRVAAAMQAARVAEGLSVEQDVDAVRDANRETNIIALPQRPAPDRRWLWVGLTAVAAALLATWFLRAPALESVPDDGVRAGTDAPLVSSLRDAVLPRDAFVLEWSGGPAAATYDIYITTPELVSVYQALDQRGRSHRVPGSALVDVPSGQRLLWRVVASGPRGRRAHSNAFEVVVE